MKLKKKTRSAIFEGGEEQSATSLVSKRSHGVLRLSSAGRFAIQPPSLLARLSFQIESVPSAAKSCLTSDNIRDIKNS